MTCATCGRPRKTKADFGALFAAYKRQRRSGRGVEEALSAATDEITGVKTVRTPEPPPPPPSGGVLGIAYSILLNAVSIAGVYLLDWPVGTGLALYWAENMLTGILLLAAIALWRAQQEGGAGTSPSGPSLGEVATITAAFNGAHLVFLLIFLGLMLPRMEVAESFDRQSFTQGVIFIATLLALQFLPGAARIRQTTAVQLQRSVTYYLQRVVVLHLTIIAGMLALFLFGNARAFFAVFAGLKLVADIIRWL